MRSAAGSFSTGSTVSTNGLGIDPSQFALIGLVGSTASPNTTMASISALSVGVGVSTGSFQWNHSYAAAFTNSSALTSAQGSSGVGREMTTAGTLGGEFILSQVASTHVDHHTAASAPLAYAVLGGDDVPAAVGLGQALSSVSGSTFSISGSSVNALFVVGHSSGSSVANLSFGFACSDTLGSITQWAIGLAGREAASGQASRSASTASVLRLHSTATTVASTLHYDVSVTSVRSTGFEMTVNAVDTNRAPSVSNVALRSPKANAGKATITTNGAGVGQTGFTVSNVGQNVGLVILASIGSSLQTVQAHNMFSLGFASSNGNQRAVSGFVTDGGGASTRYASYFGTSHAVIFVSGSSGVHPSITAPPAVITKGVYALDTASSGFTVTFDNTAANGWDVYWAALSNVVTDIGGSIQSSFNANSGLAEVGHIGGAIQAAFTEALGLTKEFEVTRGGVAGDATIETRADDGTLRWYSKTTNSTSPDVALYFDITTTPQRIGLAEYQNARHVSIIPPSTNTHPFRIAASRQSPGVLVSSQGANSFPIPEDAGSDMYLYTSVSSATIAKARVVVR